LGQGGQLQAPSQQVASSSSQDAPPPPKPTVPLQPHQYQLNNLIKKPQAAVVGFASTEDEADATGLKVNIIDILLFLEREENTYRRSQIPDVYSVLICLFCYVYFAMSFDLYILISIF